MFDQVKEYDEMLNRGIKLSGDNKEYFIFERIKYLRKQLPQDVPPRFILDFGCGVGDTTFHLSQIYPNAHIVGVDVNDNTLTYANDKYGSKRNRFHNLSHLNDEEKYNLCYTNGVFHHITPSERLHSIRKIWKILTPGGYFAFFENNPWNPGTRLVMKRIPFDRDASVISPTAAIRLLRRGGFRLQHPVRFLFFFPRSLSFLRRLESYLARFPLGGQYLVLAKK